MAKKDKKISTECLKSFKLEDQFPWEWTTEAFSDIIEKTYNLFDIDRRYYKFDCIGRKMRNLLMYTDNMKFFDIRHIIEFCSNTAITQYVIHDEAFVMLIYLRFKNDNLEELRNILVGLTIFSFVPAYIFKLWTLNQLPEDHRKVFDKCKEIMLSKGVYPKHHETSNEIKVLTFLEMFYGDIPIHDSDESVADELNQLFPNYREEMMNYYIDLLPNNMKTGFKFIQSIDELTVLLYKAMKCIKNKEDADELIKLIEEGIKNNDLMYERMSLLGHIIRDSYDIFEEVKDEACKKYPDIAEYIRSSASLTFLNVLGKIERMKRSMKYNVKGDLYDEMDNSDVAFKSSAFTTSAFSRYEGGSAPVTYSIDGLLDSLMEDYPGLEYDDIMNNIKLTLRHEMGHVIAHILKIRQSSSDYIFPASALSNKIKAKEIERRENDPEIKKLNHTVWYYSYLPEERKANALMGLTIEDMIRGNFEEITPEIKEQIASIDFHKIEVEEQRMLLEL